MRVGSTESSLLLKELYANEYLPSIGSDVAICLGAIANTNTEEPVLSKSIKEALEEYNYLSVKEYTGLNFEEYLDSTHIIRKQYRSYLEPIAIEKRESLKDMDKLKEDMGDMGNV